MSSELSIRWIKTNFAQRAVFIVFLVLSIAGSLVLFMTGRPNLSDSIDRFLGAQDLPVLIAPVLLCMIWFGASRLNHMEWIRTSAQVEFRSNLKWIAQCTLFVTLYYFAIWLLAFFCIPGYEWRANVVQLPSVTVLLVVSAFCQLFVFGLALYLLVNLGIPWGCAVPLMLVFMTMICNSIETWARPFVEAVFYFLKIVEPSFGAIMVHKVIPCVSAVVILVAANWWFYSRRDRLV